MPKSAIPNVEAIKAIKERAEALLVDIEEYNPKLYRRMKKIGKKKFMEQLVKELTVLYNEEQQLTRIIWEREKTETKDQYKMMGEFYMAKMEAQEIINEEIKQRYLIGE